MNESKKIIALLLVACALFGARPNPAQTAPAFEAEMLVPKGGDAEKVAVVVALDADALKIDGVKKPDVSKSFAYDRIKKAEYAYSEKPQIAQGTAAALLLGFAALPLFFNKTQHHWLTIDAGDDFALLKLKERDYRSLLLAMHAKKINVTDVGNRKRNEADKKKKEKKKKDESKKPEKVKTDLAS